MLHRFIDISKFLIFSFNSIALNYLSIPGDKSGDPQILDDNLVLLLSLSSLLLITVSLSFLGLLNDSNFVMSRGGNALENLVILESLDVLDFLERSPVVFLMSLADLLDLVSDTFGSLATPLVVGVIFLDDFMMTVKHLSKTKRL